MAKKKTARKKSAKSAIKKTAKKKASAKKPAVKRSAARKSRPARSASAAPAPAPRSGPGVVHWEVQATDPARQQRFFADLFGWSIDTNNPMNYGMVASAGDKAIGGGIGASTDSTARVTVYIEVPDIDQALAKAEALGARTVMPKMDMGMVVMGQFSDLEGNIIGLVQS
jgi:predicted enzyme related to lactoylglutathione lyase